MRKPAPLAPGDKVAVISPGAAVDPAALDAGIRELEDHGLEVVRGQHVLARRGYLAGSDSQRLADLVEAFRDPEIKAIIAARGGYGCGRLLPLLDPELFRGAPKIFVGHSDLTFLLTYFGNVTELVTFHGPLVAALATPSTRALVALLSGARAPWQQAAAEVIHPGTGEGRLTGGCLSIVTALLGTPWAVPTKGRILFLEDVNEKPYRIDRMLTQLRQAGAFDEVAGVVFGEMVGCSAGPGEAVTVRDVIRDAFHRAPFPVAFGLTSGHGASTVTLPLGVRARLAGERLTLLEAPLSD